MMIEKLDLYIEYYENYLYNLNRDQNTGSYSNFVGLRNKLEDRLLKLKKIQKSLRERSEDENILKQILIESNKKGKGQLI